MGLSFTEFLGYVASILVFITFYMKTMVALRCVAVASNIAFIAYGYYEGLLPILILHGLLLPTNLYRLSQIRKLVSESARFRDTGFPLEPLIPFMSERKVQAGEVLFRKGDRAGGMYYIAKGQIRIPELDVYLGAGEVLGEVGLFTPDRKRTGSAISEGDGIVYWLSETTALQVFHQSPSFGFSLVRAITARLLENRLRAERGELAREEAETTDGAPAGLSLRPSTASQELKASQAEETMRRAARRRRITRIAMVVVPLALLFGTIYSRQAYLGSLVFRDAVVTTWLYTATSPISGQVEGPVPDPGERHTEGGPLLSIRNPQADNTEMMQVAAEIGRSEDRIAQLNAHVTEMRRTLKRWNMRAEIYASVFRDSVRLELAGLKEQLAHLERQLELSERVAERVETLARSGNMAASTADETFAEIMALRSRKSELQKQLTHTERRWKAAKDGVFITSGGNNPDWVFDSSDQLELRIIETEDAIASAEGELEKLRKEYRAIKQQYMRMSRAAITIPVDSIIWSVPVGPGATVGRATPVLQWINCDQPLVDVPVAGSTLGLYSEGMVAKARIDGLDETRLGEVMYVRGGASRLDTTDLAAVAEGGGSGQVIVGLDAESADTEGCPVGRSAYVEFPAIGLMEQVAAFLRL